MGMLGAIARRLALGDRGMVVVVVGITGVEVRHSLAKVWLS